jgi:hypothetical protein
MPLQLDTETLDEIKKVFNIYQNEFDVKNLKPNDFKLILEFVGALVSLVEYQKSMIFDQTNNLRDLKASFDTLKKRSGNFMMKRKASDEVECGEVRSKRVNGGFDISQKRSRSEDSEGERGTSKRMRRYGDSGRLKRSHREDTMDEGGESKRQKKA